jgi:hypothetical protein
MKTILLIGLMLAHECMSADEAYVLVDALVVPSEATQPKWLALKGSSKFTHVPVGESIVAVEPGKYRLVHIDFQENTRSGLGTVSAPSGGETIRFEAVPNSITYVGIIELKQKSWDSNTKRYELNLRSTGEIFEWACHNNPEVFSRFPVRVAGEKNLVKEVRIRCET